MWIFFIVVADNQAILVAKYPHAVNKFLNRLGTVHKAVQSSVIVFLWIKNTEKFLTGKVRVMRKLYF